MDRHSADVDLSQFKGYFIERKWIHFISINHQDVMRIALPSNKYVLKLYNTLPLQLVTKHSTTYDVLEYTSLSPRDALKAWEKSILEITWSINPQVNIPIRWEQFNLMLSQGKGNKIEISASILYKERCHNVSLEKLPIDILFPYIKEMFHALSFFKESSFYTVNISTDFTAMSINR